jgi:hypothetical protein
MVRTRGYAAWVQVRRFTRFYVEALTKLSRDSQVYSIVASFIKRCPISNPPLPLKAFPPLTAFPANAPPGTEVTYSFKGAPGRTYYAAYYSGLTVKLVKLKNKKAAIPEGLLGAYYTVIVGHDGYAPVRHL